MTLNKNIKTKDSNKNQIQSNKLERMNYEKKIVM